MAVLTSLPTLHCSYFPQHTQYNARRSPQPRETNTMPSPKTSNMSKPKDVVVSVERLDQSTELDSRNPKQGVNAAETHGEGESITSSTHIRERDTQDEPAYHPIRLVRAVTVPMTMEQGLSLRRSSEAAIEARLALIPGRLDLNDGLPEHDPETIARLRREQSRALAGLKKSVMFQASEDMTTAVEDIDRRKMWKNWSTGSRNYT